MTVRIVKDNIYMAEKRIKVLLTPAGNAWESTREYKMLDYIADGTTLYVCVRTDAESGVNVGHALTETGWWSKCIDMSEAVAAATTAAKAANDAASDAQETAAAAVRATGEAANAARTATSGANTAATKATDAASAANTAATAANTAAGKATTATTAAEKVNATITADNVMEVTDRTGAKKTLLLVTAAQAEQTAADVAELKKTVETWVNASGFVGFARVNGDTSPGAEEAYGTAERVHEVGARWRLCTVKDGVVTHRCAPGRLTLGTLGEEVKIDGSDGDVMLCCEDGLELLKDTRTVDGRELNIIGLGTQACAWYGSESKHLKPFGITPCATVNAKILDDVREQAHCVYNTGAQGTGVPTGQTMYKARFKKDGGGWPSSYVSCIKSIQEAQAKNADPLTNRPWTGLYYEYYEAILAMMYAETGTLDHTHYNLMGVGVTSAAKPDGTNFYDANGSALSGWMLRTADGTAFYGTPWSSLYTVEGHTAVDMLRGQLCQSGYAIVGVLEAQRVLDGISKAGLVGEIGAEGALFCFNEDGDIEMYDTADPSTGEGMESCKMYYQVRDVPHCEGMADGVMTAVVNRWVKLEINDGFLAFDKETSMDGGIAVLKCSIPVYRGWTLPLAGMFIQTMGAYHYEKISEDGVRSVYFSCANDVDAVPPLTSFGETAYWNRTAKDVPPLLLNGLAKRQEKTGMAAITGEAWMAKADYGMSLLCGTQMQNGAGQHTKECAYLWLYLTQSKENGSMYVHGSVCGGSAGGGWVSARSAFCNYGAGNGFGNYAGAGAVLLGQK